MRLSGKTRALALAGGLLVGGVAVAAAATNDPQIATLAGIGESGFSGDGGSAAAARLNVPRRVAIASDGILVADVYNHRVRKIGFDGKITTAAGTGVAGDDGDGGPATAAQLDEPAAVTSLAGGGFLVADRGNARVRKVGPGGTISTVVGGVRRTSDDDDDDGPRLEYPQDLSLTSEGGYLIADAHADRIFEISSNGSMRSVAGTGSRGSSGDGAAAASARLNDPRGVAVLPDGGFLIADTGNHRIRRVDPAGRISTVAGSGVSGFSGDGGKATAAKLHTPVGLALTPGGGYLIADRENHRMREVSADGVIDTLVGTGEGGYNGDSQAPTLTQLNEPRGAAMVPGHIVIADGSNHRVRHWSLQSASESGPSELAEAAGEALPPLAPPVAGKRVNAAPVRGEVRVKVRGSDAYVDLTAAASIPIGSAVNATRGAVRITSAADLSGGTQAAIFSDGAFGLRQRRQRRPVTQLVLRGGDFRSCRRGGAARSSASAEASRRRSRRGLWGRGKGRFQTRGRHGAATVRGTIWFTADRCAGTLVRVRRGKVAVSDFARRRRVLVPAGRSYLARPRASRRRNR